MGKHERELIEQAEKILVKILNSRPLGNSDIKNHWFRHAQKVAEQIKRDFKNITSVRHLGNRYNSPGDIAIIANENEFFVEVKMSDTKKGIGTKANISQDALTECGLFKNNVKSWSAFREEENHEKWVQEYLDQFNRYPKDILKIVNPMAQKEARARFLRTLSRKGNNRAKEILNKIQGKDKKEKIKYLSYLSRQIQSREMTKKFFTLIMTGVHKLEVLKRLIENEGFFHKIQDLIICYSNFSKGKIIVKKEDIGKRVQKIIKKYPTFGIIFPRGLSHCKIVGIKTGRQEPLMQIVFHWKNIAQGIKTPCLNIFDLTR